mgnify:CR=1 FL=1
MVLKKFSDWLEWDNNMVSSGIRKKTIRIAQVINYYVLLFTEDISRGLIGLEPLMKSSYSLGSFPNLE